jgi:hypothetical protein
MYVYDGYTEDQFLTMTLKDIRRPQDVPTMVDAVCTTDGVYKGTWKHRTQTGKLIDVEITSHDLPEN